MNEFVNKRVFLSNRPGANGIPQKENFSCEVCPYPNELADGQVLVETLYLSVDPYMRCRMNEDSGVDYAPAWGIGETLNGPAVGMVIESKSDHLNPSDLVTSVGLDWSWKTYNVLPESSVRKLDGLSRDNAHLALGVFGITGLTAALGVMEKGNIVNGSNQTMVISGAAGACGSVAGQVGKILGCGQLIGICGSEAKCNFIMKNFGFDEAICYKTQDVYAELQKLCPAGVDVYFDNVGGDISDAVIKSMNKDSSIVLCGQIAVYNKDLPYPPPLLPEINNVIEKQNISRDRFLVLNYESKFPDTWAFLMDAYKKGQIKSHETVMEDLENAGKAFVSLMNGGNIGKQIVKL